MNMKNISLLIVSMFAGTLIALGAVDVRQSLCDRFSFSSVCEGPQSYQGSLAMFPRHYVLYDFVPSIGKIFYLRGYPMGQGLGFFTYASDYEMHADFGEGFVRVDRQDSGTGVKR